MLFKFIPESFIKIVCQYNILKSFLIANLPATCKSFVVARHNKFEQPKRAEETWRLTKEIFACIVNFCVVRESKKHCGKEVRKRIQFTNVNHVYGGG